MKIMAIGTHLDDIEIACGGILAKAVAGGGHSVKVLIMSKSVDIQIKMDRFSDQMR